MLYISAILGLAITAAALDIHLEFTSGCSDGPGLICSNANPNQCCSTPAKVLIQSISARDVPPNWSLELRGYEGLQCSTPKTLGTICLNSGPYTSANYILRSAKREEQDSPCSLAPESCTETQKPDVLYLADGQKYNVASMEAQLLEELIGLSINITAAADIPKDFKKFEISA